MKRDGRLLEGRGGDGLLHGLGFAGLLAVFCECSQRDKLSTSLGDTTYEKNSGFTNQFRDGRD